MRIYKIILGILLFFVFSCNNKEKKTSENLLDSAQIRFLQGKIKAVGEKVFDFHFGRFSQKEKVSYHSEWLFPAKRLEFCESEHKKALSLGILWADLNYIISYRKIATMVNYLTISIENSKDLRIKPPSWSLFFQQKGSSEEESWTIISEWQNANVDSLKSFLQENSTSQNAILILYGAEMENLFLILQISEKKNLNELEFLKNHFLLLKEMNEVFAKHNENEFCKTYQKNVLQLLSFFKEERLNLSTESQAELKNFLAKIRNEMI